MANCFVQVDYKWRADLYNEISMLIDLYVLGKSIICWFASLTIRVASNPLALTALL